MTELCSSDLGDLVEALTKNANLELNQDMFKKIKHLCRLSSENVSQTFYLLMTQLRKEHAEIRYIILGAINELFLRSYEFRILLEKNLEEFLELTLEINPEKSLPPPKAIAERVKSQAQCIIKSWHVKFGDSCKRLDLACSFLKNCKNINLDSNLPLVRGIGLQQENPSRKRSRAKKISAAKKEFEDMESELPDVLLQIENCFQLIIPAANDLFTSQDFLECNTSQFPAVTCGQDHDKMGPTVSNNLAHDSGLDNEPLKDSNNKAHISLRQHGITDIKSNISVDVNEISDIVIEENGDNVSLLENLNDLHRQIFLKYLPAVVRLSKIFTQDENCTDVLKKTIDWKCSLEGKVAKFNKLSFKSKVLVTDNFLNCVQENESDSDFEEVQEKEGFEEHVPSEKCPLSSESNCENSLAQPSCSSSDRHETLCKDFKASVSSQGINDSTDMQTNPSLKSAAISLNEPSTSNDWQDSEFLEDIKAAIGVDLKIPEKRKRKNQTNTNKSGKKEATRTNIKASKNTTYSRLYKKIFKK